MSTPTFYHPELTPNDHEVQLSANESSHAARARRLQVGSPVRLLNGQGMIAEAEMLTVDARQVSVRINDIREIAAPAQKLSVACAVPKGDRQRAMIEMLTQLGVSEIIPLECEHSVTRYKPAMHDKWGRWAIEACKQSQNPWLPIIDEGISLVDLLKIVPQRILFADIAGGELTALQAEISEPILVIGPEGGFSPAELGLFGQNQIKSFSLGGYILRTETAAVSAATLALASR